MEPMSFVGAMKHFFGLRPGKDNKDFLQEMRALSDADRAYFSKHLTNAGYNII